MHPVSALLCFGIRQVLGVDAQDVAAAVEQHFRDHSQTLPRALARANDKAWRALGVALAGDGLYDRARRWLTASGDERAFREQVAHFLACKGVSYEGSPAQLRSACREDLNRALRDKALSAEGLSAGDLALGAADFRRYAEPQALLRGAEEAVARVAEALQASYPSLARLLAQPTPGGPPLLVAAFSYFFRREVEKDDELANGLLFDGLRQLSAAQNRGFKEVGEALDALGARLDQAFEEMALDLERTRQAAGETQPLFEKALTICRKALGQEHPLTALSYTNVATNLWKQGKIAEAVRLLQDSLPGQEIARFHSAPSGFDRAVAASQGSPWLGNDCLCIGREPEQSGSFLGLAGHRRRCPVRVALEALDLVEAPHTHRARVLLRTPSSLEVPFMAEKTIVLCEFNTVTEAHVALACLQAESIPAFVTGDSSEPTSYSLFGRMGYARIEVHVDAAQAERARESLEAVREAALEKGWEAEAENAIDGWICANCDTEVEQAENTCPACGEPRPEDDRRNRGLNSLAGQLVTPGQIDGRITTRPPEPVSPAAFQPGKLAGPAGIQAEEPLPPWEQPGAFLLDCEPHRGNLLWWMGAVSLTCTAVPMGGVGALALALTTWWLARRDLAQMRKGLMDPSGERLTRDARDGSIVAVVLAPLITLYALAILLG